MRPFFIGLSVALGFSINPMVLAQVAGAELQSMIQNLKLTKSDISKMINLLLSSGKISKQQAEDAQKKLSSMSEGEVKSLSMEALSNIHNGSPLFADEEARPVSEVKKDSEVAKGPARLPASPFFSVDEVKYEWEEERERKKREEVQKKLLKNAFDVKKFQ
jgi:hypothetical protein